MSFRKESKGTFWFLLPEPPAFATAKHKPNPKDGAQLFTNRRGGFPKSVSLWKSVLSNLLFLAPNKKRNFTDLERKVFAVPSLLLFCLSPTPLLSCNFPISIPPSPTLSSLLIDYLLLVFCKRKALGLFQMPVASGSFCWVSHHPFPLHWEGMGTGGSGEARKEKAALTAVGPELPLARSWAFCSLNKNSPTNTDITHGHAVTVMERSKNKTTP